MKACVLMRVQPGKHNQVATQVSKLSGVKIAFPTLGRQDVVADVEAASVQALASLLSRIQAMENVRGTETLVAIEV